MDMGVALIFCLKVWMTATTTGRSSPPVTLVLEEDAEHLRDGEND
jgi:hypothetical protein